ncbi:MAG: hypothetical protein H0X03_04270 [Nitrosopumilus sp.]|nr:hypothetical protein [Nitrosopumilus sp.]
MKPPFRIVARMSNKINTKKHMEANMTLKQIYNSEFDKFYGILLYPYDIHKIQSNTTVLWLENILKNHHSIIFVIQTAEGEGIAFDRD